MKNSAIIFILLLLPLISYGCAALDDTEAAQPDYDETKRMVVDMLQTEEGKNAIQEVLKEDEVKEELLMEQDFIKETIEQTLASEDGKEYWQEVMKNPDFAKTFAESVQEENEQLLKGLMKDPDYQDMMIDILKDPEMEENYVELMKSKNSRKELMTIVTEAMESPFFIARVNELLTEIAKQELQSPEGGGGEEESDNEDEDEDEELGF